MFVPLCKCIQTTYYKGPGPEWLLHCTAASCPCPKLGSLIAVSVTSHFMPIAAAISVDDLT